MKRGKLVLIIGAGLVAVCLICLVIGTVYNMTPQGKASNATSTAKAILRQTESAQPTRTASPAPTQPVRSAPTVALETSTATPARPMATGTATRPTFTWTPSRAPTARPTSTLAARSAPTVALASPPAVAAPCDCAVSDYNCDHFRTQREAQACYDACGGTASNNKWGLDRDHDGRVCETLP